MQLKRPLIVNSLPAILTCEPFEHGNILETLEVVNEHIGDPEIIEELQGDWIPEVRLQAVVCPDAVLTPHHAEIWGCHVFLK